MLNSFFELLWLGKFLWIYAHFSCRFLVSVSTACIFQRQIISFVHLHMLYCLYIKHGSTYIVWKNSKLLLVALHVKPITLFNM